MTNFLPHVYNSREARLVARDQHAENVSRFSEINWSEVDCSGSANFPESDIFHADDGLPEGYFGSMYDGE